VSAIDVLGAAGLGLGLGVVTGMPLGVINVAVIDAASAGARRFATGIGVGGAIADTAHATLAFAGVGHVVTEHPEWMRALAIIAAIAIAIYVIVAWRRRPTAATRDDRGPLRGIVTGALLTLPNPGALGAWVAVAASVWPHASLVAAVVLGVGVGVGSAAWFAVLAWLITRIPPNHAAVRIISRAALVALVAIAIVGVVRAL
jgi:threonine/homoserine/homoserine lactone efflux protein